MALMTLLSRSNCKVQENADVYEPDRASTAKRKLVYEVKNGSRQIQRLPSGTALRKETGKPFCSKENLKLSARILEFEKQAPSKRDEALRDALREDGEASAQSYCKAFGRRSQGFYGDGAE